MEIIGTKHFYFYSNYTPKYSNLDNGFFHNRICYTVKTLDFQHSTLQFLESPSLIDNSVTYECFVAFLSRGTSSKSCPLSSAFCRVK